MWWYLHTNNLPFICCFVFHFGGAMTPLYQQLFPHYFHHTALSWTLTTAAVGKRQSHQSKRKVVQGHVPTVTIASCNFLLLFWVCIICCFVLGFGAMLTPLFQQLFSHTVFTPTQPFFEPSPAIAVGKRDKSTTS
jgi:hypothetical protein